MSTISTAVQELVNNLTQKMQSSQPYSPEEQLLISKAVGTLRDNESWEKAIVAVAEEHINDATTALTNARTDILAAKTSIETQNSNLALVPTIQNNIQQELDKIDPTVRTAAKSNLNQFTMGYYLADHMLESRNDSNGYNQTPANVYSFENYASGEFYLFADFGTGTSTYRRSHITKIKRDGTVASATRASQFFTSGTYGFFPFSDGSSRLFRYAEGSLYIGADTAFSWQFNKPVDYLKLYYDKSTKDLYCVSSGFLNKINKDGFVIVTDTTFLDQDSFIKWAEQNTHLDVTVTLGYYNNARSVSHYYSDNSFPFQYAHLPAYYGAQSNSYTARVGFDLKSGSKLAPHSSSSNMQLTNVRGTPIGGSTTYFSASEFKDMGRWADIYGNHDLIKVDYNVAGTGYHHQSYINYPTYIAYSHQHKALFWTIAGRGYLVTSSYQYYSAMGLSFGR